MAYFEQLHHLQLQDILKISAALLAASGGIWVWVDKYRSRVRVRIRNVRLGSSNMLIIAFGAENISSIMTSYEPTLHLTGYHSEPAKRTKYSYQFTAEMTDRQLTPHVEKLVVAIHNEKDKPGINFLWYMTLTVTLTRGRKIRVRIRNAYFERMGFLRFQWERFCYLAFGKTPDRQDI